MARLLVIVIILSALCFFNSDGAKILCVFPMPCMSHHLVYRVLTEELAKRGHEVVVLTTHPAFPPGRTPSNLTEIDIGEHNYIMRDGLTPLYMNNTSSVIKAYLRMFTKILDNQIQLKPVQELIKNKEEHFDLLIFECTLYSTLGFTHVFNAPVIHMSTYGPMSLLYSLFGAPNHPLLYTTAVNRKLYNLTFWESLQNMYMHFVAEYDTLSHEIEENEMLQRNFGSDIAPLSELLERVNLYFQSVHSIWLNNPAVPKNIVYMGGLHEKLTRALPKDLETFLDSSKNGAIYVSFGTNVNVSLLSSEKKDMMTRVFTKLPYKVLWKRDEKITETVKNIKNIKISSWFPQADLLKHPNIKLFITQGGLQSTQEAITAEVPLIGIPIFGDQWYQVENYVYHRIGIPLDWNALTEDEFERSISRVIEDKSYKENIVRLNMLLKDQPQTAMESAIWWIEYVLRHGSTRHLRPASANMSWQQYFEIELVLIVLVFVLSGFTISSFILYKLIRWLCSFRVKKHVKN